MCARSVVGQNCCETLSRLLFCHVNTAMFLTVRCPYSVAVPTGKHIRSFTRKGWGGGGGGGGGCLSAYIPRSFARPTATVNVFLDH